MAERTKQVSEFPNHLRIQVSMNISQSFGHGVPTKGASDSMLSIYRNHAKANVKLLGKMAVTIDSKCLSEQVRRKTTNLIPSQSYLVPRAKLVAMNQQGRTSWDPRNGDL